MNFKFLFLIFILAVFAGSANAQKKLDNSNKNKPELKQKTEEKNNDRMQEAKKAGEEKSENQQKQEPRKQPIKLSDPLFRQQIQKKKQPAANVQDSPKIKFPKKYKHLPYKQLDKVQQQIRYAYPIRYHYHVPPKYIYRGLWIRFYFVHTNGFYFYNGYPYYVHNNILHRYSELDPGFFDLVDSYTDEVYATFYGNNLKQSYDRCARIRDLLNSEEGAFRYFCAERFEYDPDYNYGWNPEDFPDWYWY